MNKTLKIALLGFLSWLIPFVFSFFFYSKEGKPLIDIFLFKSIMIVVASVVGAFFLIKYFKAIKENYLKEGVIVGVAWFTINIALDLIVLLPLMKVSIATYFAQIGLRYLIIPVMSTAMGYLLQNISKKTN